jgi:hypothetical protein
MQVVSSIAERHGLFYRLQRTQPVTRKSGDVMHTLCAIRSPANVTSRWRARLFTDDICVELPPRPRNRRKMAFSPNYKSVERFEDRSSKLRQPIFDARWLRRKNMARD